MATKPRAVVRPLALSDPRSLSHPNHRESWLQLAEEMGRLEAREMIRLQRQGGDNDNTPRVSSE